MPRGSGAWSRVGWEFGVGRCKLLHLGWINNKVLLESTGNYIQSPGTNHNGEEYLKKNACMCKTESLLYSRDRHNIVHQLYFSERKSFDWLIGTLISKRTSPLAMSLAPSHATYHSRGWLCVSSYHFNRCTFPSSTVCQQAQRFTWGKVPHHYLYCRGQLT